MKYYPELSEMTDEQLKRKLGPLGISVVTGWVRYHRAIWDRKKQKPAVIERIAKIFKVPS